jgi:pectate lyase
MKRAVTVCSVLLLTLITVALSAADSSTAKTKWIKGWVSDSKCGVKGAAAGHEACGKKCLAAGEHVVFVSEHDKKVYKVDNEDALKDQIGHRMAVKGTVDQASDTIHVDKANRLPEKGGASSGGEMK